MKKVWLAAALLVLIPVLLFVSHGYLARSTGQLTALLQQADSLSARGQKADAEREVENFLTLWSRKREILATFTRHSELDPANLSASRLLPLLRSGETGDFHAECSGLITQFEHIVESDQFTLSNVL